MSVIARGLTLTPRGRRALLLDDVGIALPASYSAWGATDSPLCLNGHPRRQGQCGACSRQHSETARRHPEAAA